MSERSGVDISKIKTFTVDLSVFASANFSAQTLIRDLQQRNCTVQGGTADLFSSLEGEQIPPVTYRVAVASVMSLGFEMGALFEQFAEQVKKLGFEFGHKTLGPAWCSSVHSSDDLSGSIHFLTAPLYNGGQNPYLLTVNDGGYGRVLSHFYCHPERYCAPHLRFAFVHPRED